MTPTEYRRPSRLLLDRSKPWPKQTSGIAIIQILLGKRGRRVRALLAEGGGQINRAEDGQKNEHERVHGCDGTSEPKQDVGRIEWMPNVAISPGLHDKAW